MKLAPPTAVQRELLGEVIGIGPLKFGMEVEDFAKADLTVVSTGGGGTFAEFEYAKVPELTWGNLHPDRIDLRFYYDHLVAIVLHFNEPYGDLLATNWALCQKYGSSSENAPYAINVSNGASVSHTTKIWRSVQDKIEMSAAFPDAILYGSDDSALTSRTDGAVEFYDAGLDRKLNQDHHDDLQQQILQSHDLEKIKKDL